VTVCAEARRHAVAAQGFQLVQNWPAARAHLDAALSALGTAPPHARRDCREAVADLLVKRGEIGVSEGRPVLARADLEAALREYAALGVHDGPYVSSALTTLGLAYRELGDPDRATVVLQQALELKHRGRESVSSISATYVNVALARQDAGDLGGADRALAAALDLPGLSVDRAARLRQEQAFHLMKRGDFAAALVLLARRLDEIAHLEASGQLPEPSLERAICLGNLGACYDELRDPARARQFLRDAVAARRVRVPGSLALATALSNLAGVLDQPGEAAERHAALTEAVAIAEREGPGSDRLAIVRGALVGFLAERGRPREAVALAERTIAEAPAANRALATVYLTAAVALLDLGERERAEVMVGQALAVCRRVSPHLADLRPVLTVLGRLAHVRADLDAAATYYDDAIAIAERFRAGAAREPGLERAFSRAGDAYHGRIDVAHQRIDSLATATDATLGFAGTNAAFHRAQAQAAFRAAEAFRARSLAEMLSERAPGGRPPAPPDPLHDRLAAIYRMLDGRGPALDARQAAELAAERDALEAEAERRRLRLLADRPQDADRWYPAPCTVREVQARLAPDQTLALFQVTGAGVYLFRVTRDGFAFHRLPAGPAEVSAAVDEVLASCRDRRAAPPDAALGRLDGWLAAPLAGITGQLIVCPDTTLAYLPFEALPRLAGCVVSYTPSATTLVRFADRPRPAPVHEFVGFAVHHTPGLPDLPDADDEVLDAAALFPGATLCGTGAEVTTQTVRRYASGGRYVHVAAHGIVRDDRPIYSGIALPDGFLYAFDMFTWSLCADVVVLSACESAVGEARGGEGIVGLSRALFAAGARAVLLTRWNVRSLAARSLMDAFYRHLATGRQPARALADAVALVRRDQPIEFAHPREWAAFTLIDTAPGG
jgi:tetratricopeptide (TPR) repeat protein